MTRWSRFSSEGATTSRGSGVTRVYEVDQTIDLFPFPLAIFIHLTDLTQYRLAEMRELLEDAHRAWPHLAMRVQDFFIEEFNHHNTILRMFHPSQRLVEAILLTITRGPSHTYGPPPTFFLGNDAMPRYVGLHEWCMHQADRTVDGVHLDTFWCWARYMAYPYLAAMSPAMGTCFAELQARLPAQPEVTNLEQLRRS